MLGGYVRTHTVDAESPLATNYLIPDLLPWTHISFFAYYYPVREHDFQSSKSHATLCLRCYWAALIVLVALPFHSVSSPSCSPWFPGPNKSRNTSLIQPSCRAVGLHPLTRRAHVTQFALQNSGNKSPLHHQTGVSCPSDPVHKLNHHCGG